MLVGFSHLLSTPGLQDAYQFNIVRILELEEDLIICEMDFFPSIPWTGSFLHPSLPCLGPSARSDGAGSGSHRSTCAVGIHDGTAFVHSSLLRVIPESDESNRSNSERVKVLKVLTICSRTSRISGTPPELPSAFACGANGSEGLLQGVGERELRAPRGCALARAQRVMPKG